LASTEFSSLFSISLSSKSLLVSLSNHLQSRSQSYLTTDGQSASVSGIRPPLGTRDPIFLSHTKKQTPWPLVRKRTIPAERPPLVDEILIPTFVGRGVSRVQRGDFLFCGSPSLTREPACNLSVQLLLGLRQRCHSYALVPQDSWPYFIVSFETPKSSRTVRLYLYSYEFTSKETPASKVPVSVSLCFTANIYFNMPVTNEVPYLLFQERYLRNIAFIQLFIDL
jgi:hypothetical protein